jgi:putative FmdB family regulatory protein
MPLYEYQCDACGQRFELIQKYSAGPPEACPKCGKGPVQRLQSSPAFHLKGSGWYITDYARKGTSSEGESAKGEGSKGEGSKGEGSKKTDAGVTPSSSTDSGGDSKKADSTPAPAPSAPAKPPAG